MPLISECVFCYTLLYEAVTCMTCGDRMCDWCYGDHLSEQGWCAD